MDTGIANAPMISIPMDMSSPISSSFIPLDSKCKLRTSEYIPMPMPYMASVIRNRRTPTDRRSKFLIYPDIPITPFLGDTVK
ncbi:hypothetical protein D3C76_1280030 [compost metagenome]